MYFLLKSLFLALIFSIQSPPPPSSHSPTPLPPSPCYLLHGILHLQKRSFPLLAHEILCALRRFARCYRYRLRRKKVCCPSRGLPGLLIIVVILFYLSLSFLPAILWLFRQFLFLLILLHAGFVVRRTSQPITHSSPAIASTRWEQFLR